MKCNAIGWDVHCTTQSTFLYWPICTNREHFLADQFLSRAICPRSAGGFLLVGFSSQKLQNCKSAKQLVEITYFLYVSFYTLDCVILVPVCSCNWPCNLQCSPLVPFVLELNIVILQCVIRCNVHTIKLYHHTGIHFIAV